MSYFVALSRSLGSRVSLWVWASGLAYERLARDGITAIAVHCTGSEGARHLHPQEAGLFCTLPPTFVYPKLRECLPLIGQTAAPLQAHWIVALMRLALHSGDCDAPGLVDPFRGHVKFQSRLQHLAFHLWPTQLTSAPRSALNLASWPFRLRLALQWNS